MNYSKTSFILSLILTFFILLAAVALSHLPLYKLPYIIALAVFFIVSIYYFVPLLILLALVFIFAWIGIRRKEKSIKLAKWALLILFLNFLFAILFRLLTISPSPLEIFI